MHPVPMRVFRCPAKRHHRLVFQQHQRIRSNIFKPFIVKTPLELTGRFVFHQRDREHHTRASRTGTRPVRQRR